VGELEVVHAGRSQKIPCFFRNQIFKEKLLLPNLLLQSAAAARSVHSVTALIASLLTFEWFVPEQKL
jgi:hypothetical protein